MLGLVETWATSYHAHPFRLPQGCEYFSSEAVPSTSGGRASGGLSIIVRQDLGLARLLFCSRHVLAVEIQLQTTGTTLVFAECYVPPGSRPTAIENTTEARAQFCQFLQIVPPSSHLVIAGDFNAHKDRHDKLWEWLVTMAELHQLEVQVPTRPTHDRGGTLDYFLNRNCAAQSQVLVRAASAVGIASDHSCISCSFVVQNLPAPGPRLPLRDDEHVALVEMAKVLAPYTDPAWRHVRVAVQTQICDDMSAFAAALTNDAVGEAAAWLDARLRTITKQLPRNEPLGALISLSRSERRAIRQATDATEMGTQPVRQLLAVRKSIESARQRRLYQGVGLMARHNILKPMWATLSAEAGIRPKTEREHPEANIDAQVWYQYCQTLFQGPDMPPLPAAGMDTLTISPADVARGLARLKRNKCADSNGVVADALKNCIPPSLLGRPDVAMDDKVQWPSKPILEMLADMFSTCCSTRSVPQQWCNVDHVALPKTGDLNLPRNYRLIAIGSTVGKLFRTIITCKMEDWSVATEQLHGSQCGFRPNRSTADCVAILNEVLFHRRATGGTTFAVAVDVRKAYDSVDPAQVCSYLRERGANSTLVDMLHIMFSQAAGRMKVGQTYTPFYPIRKGVPQGAPEAPLIFALLFEVALKISREFPGTLVLPVRRGGVGQPVSVTTLAYADDVLLICKNLSEAQAILRRLEHALQSISLQLNASKCQLIAFRQACRVPRNMTEQLITLDGSVIPTSTEVKYLGMTLTAQGTVKYAAHLQQVLCRMKTALGSLTRQGLLDGRLPTMVVRQLLIQTVFSHAEYACAVLPTHGPQITALLKHQVKAARDALRLSVYNSPRRVLLELGLMTITARYRWHRLRLAAAKLVQSDSNRSNDLLAEVLAQRLGHPSDQSTRLRPLSETIVMDLKHIGLLADDGDPLDFFSTRAATRGVQSVFAELKHHWALREAKDVVPSDLLGQVLYCSPADDTPRIRFPAYHAAQGKRIRLHMRLGTYECGERRLIRRTHLHLPVHEQEAWCPLCANQTPATLDHLLLTCPSEELSSLRQDLWHTLVSKCESYFDSVAGTVHLSVPMPATPLHIAELMEPHMEGQRKGWLRILLAGCTDWGRLTVGEAILRQLFVPSSATRPSAQIHFVDLASSWSDGNLPHPSGGTVAKRLRDDVLRHTGEYLTSVDASYQLAMRVQTREHTP